jgi:hypothetical protein
MPAQTMQPCNAEDDSSLSTTTEIRPSFTSYWDVQELAELWSLTQEELALMQNRTTRGRLGFAILLKFFQIGGRFPSEHQEVPKEALNFLARKFDVAPEVFGEYDLTGRSCERDRAQIRSLLGFRSALIDDGADLLNWLRREVLPNDHQEAHLREATLEWYPIYPPNCHPALVRSRVTTD